MEDDGYPNVKILPIGNPLDQSQFTAQIGILGYQVTISRFLLKSNASSIIRMGN